MARARWSLVLVLAALAGCVEHAHLDPLPPAGSAGGPTDSDAPGGGLLVADGNATTSARVQPVHVHLRHDYTQSTEDVTFEMPAHPGRVTFHVGFEPWSAAPACESYGTTLWVERPDGSVYKELGGGTLWVLAGGPCGGSATETSGQGWAAGVWTAHFAGTGLATGVVTADNEA